MNVTVPLKDRVEALLGKNCDALVGRVPERPTVLVATVDPEIRDGLTDLFEAFALNPIWVHGIQAAKIMLAKERVAACLCGFWLQDGTYRELVRHIRREQVKIPVIIVSPPACPDEYRDYLTAMNIGALDFLCHPYQKAELEKMLWLVMDERERSGSKQASMMEHVLHTGEAA